MAAAHAIFRYSPDASAAGFRSTTNLGNTISARRIKHRAASGQCLRKQVPIVFSNKVLCSRPRTLLVAVNMGNKQARQASRGKSTKEGAVPQASSASQPEAPAAMSLKLGDVVPNFDADTTAGPINFHEYIKGGWAILFSHPADFTPVCTTELGAVGVRVGEFAKRGVKVLALSCDEVESHKRWIADIEAYTPASKVDYPIIADPKREIAVKYGMLDPDEIGKDGIPLTARAVFVVGPDLKLKLSILYPATTGRNFDEVLRVIDSLQLTANHSVATPVDWKHGDRCMVVPSLTDEQANAKFPKGFEKATLPSGKGYVRLTPQPNLA